MVTLDVAAVRPGWWTEVRGAMKDALAQSRAVLVTLIICATLVILAVVGVLGWLAWAQRDASMVMSLVNTLVNVFVLKRLSDVNGRIWTIEQQTNGNTQRLMDAAFGKNRGSDER